MYRRYIRDEEKATQYVQFNYVFRQMKLAIWFVVQTCWNRKVYHWFGRFGGKENVTYLRKQ